MGDLDGLKIRQRAAATLATEKWADAVLGAAQRIAPLEEGTLAGSADRETHVAGNVVTVELSFSTVYAAAQHERLDYVHPHGRQAKYLEGPFKQAVPRYAPIVAAAMRKAI